MGCFGYFYMVIECEGCGNSIKCEDDLLDVISLGWGWCNCVFKERDVL